MQPRRPEVRVFCGGLSPRPDDVEMALVLDTGAPPGSAGRVTINLGPLSRKMLAHVPARLADLIEIAAYVYCADQFSRRETPVMRDLGADWRRRFAFDIPVRDLPFWNQDKLRQALAEALGFLSDDVYRFRFHYMASEAGALDRYLDLGTEAEASSSSREPPRFSPERVILFSGGLDSFAGAAETLIAKGERAVLVSHQAAPLVRSRQADLVQALRSHTSPGQLMHIGIEVHKGGEDAREYTQRSRSFLFATLGFVVARLFELQDVLFFENGVVSLNLPVAQHVIGSRATRTTHPRVLYDLGQLFTLVAGQPIEISNPYFWRTKADVVEQIAVLGRAEDIATTFSCARVREAAQLGGRHCGACSQCLDRRFGVLAAGQGTREPEDFYALELLTAAREPGIETTQAESFVLAATKFASMSEPSFLARYGEVFRALPYLEGDISANASRLLDLHRRHGAAVTRVIDEALAQHSSLDAMSALPDSCLLSLLRAPLTRVPPLVDAPAQTDPSPARQAETSTRQEIERPIRLAIDSQARQLVFAAGFSVKGRGYELIAALVKEFHEDQAAGRPPANYRYIPWKEVARRLGSDEPALRKAVTRLRRAVAEKFRMLIGVAPADDDIVQNQRWQGYRLNPHLVIQPVAVLRAQPRPTDPSHEKTRGREGRMSRL